MEILKKILVGILYVLKSILDVILTNKFVQICLVIVLLNLFPGYLFKHTKFGIFINGTDNTYHNNYKNERLEK